MNRKIRYPPLAPAALAWRPLPPSRSRQAVAHDIFHEVLAAAIGIGPCAALCKRGNPQHGLVIVGAVRILTSWCRSAWGQPNFWAEIPQIDQQCLVFPAVRHRNVAPGAAQFSTQPVHVIIMQIALATGTIVKTAFPASVVPARVIRLFMALETKQISVATARIGPISLQQKIVA